MHIAIDIGATKTAVAAFLSPNPGTLIDEQIFPTQHTYQEQLIQLGNRIKALSQKGPVERIGVSLAASITPDGMIVSKSNIPTFRGTYLARDLTRLCLVPVEMANDAVCAGLAEMMIGVGKEATTLLQLVLGTGMGGALWWNTKHGKECLPLEPGWMIIHPGGMAHTNRQIKGLVEAYVGGAQLEAQLQSSLEVLPDNHRIFTQVTNYLGMTLYNLITLLKPDQIVLAGGLIAKRSFLLPGLVHYLEQFEDFTIPTMSITTFPNPCLIGTLYLPV